MSKRSLSLFTALAVAALSAAPCSTIYAVEAGSIEIASVSAEAGDTVEVPIELRSNPGVVGMSLELSYDTDKLELTGTTDGKILGASAYSPGGDLKNVPYTMNWDDNASENNVGTGTLVTVSFHVKEGASGEAKITASIIQRSTFDVDFAEVPFEVKSGAVNIGSRNSAPEANISVEDTSATAGQEIEVPVIMENNPGIAAMSLDLTYDTDKLELLGAVDGKILGTSTFSPGEDVSAVPYKLNWDDLSTVNNTGNGTLVMLRFRVKETSSGEAKISIAVDQSSTFNIDFDEVGFETEGGIVNISGGTTSSVPPSATTSTTTANPSATTSAATTTTTKPTTTSAASTTTPKPTTTSAASTTTTKPTTTSAISTTATAIPIISISSVEAEAGQEIEVPVIMENNPGIAAISLELTYDTDKLELLGASDGKILGTSTFSPGGNVSAVPYKLNWDDLSDKNNTGSGILASLRFRVKDSAVGKAEISLSVDQNSTFNIDFEDVIFETVSGNVDIAAQTGTATSPAATTTTSTTAAETTTTPSIVFLLGDVTGDGIIDGRDATDVLTDYAKTSTGQESKYNEQQKKAADVNDDKIIDGRDATAILTYYAKTSTGYERSFVEYIGPIK